MKKSAFGNTPAGISVRNKIEQAHHEWMFALDVVDDPIFLHDKEFRILRCNKAYQQRAGIPFHELIGQPYYEVFPKNHAPLPCCLRAIEKAEEEEVVVGDVIYRSRAFSVHDEQGAYLYSIHTMEDITERKRVEQALKKSEAMLKEAQHIAGVGNWMWNTETDIRHERDLALLKNQEQLVQLVFQNEEKEKRAAELAIANKELVFQNEEKEKRAAELAIANKELVFQNEEKEKRAAELAIANKELQDSLEDTVRAIATIGEMRDPYTSGHQVRVANLATAIAKQLGLPDEQVHAIHLAGMVHDLGKIKVPAEILSKPGRITDIEFSLIKIHPQAGYDILKGIDFPWPIAQMVLQHHERLDGSGYPQGLKGEQIIIEARILCVADVVEAMSSHRPYRPGLGIEVALAEITRQRGIHFDPAVVDACLALFREQHYSFKS